MAFDPQLACHGFVHDARSVVKQFHYADMRGLDDDKHIEIASPPDDPLDQTNLSIRPALDQWG